MVVILVPVLMSCGPWAIMISHPNVIKEDIKDADSKADNTILSFFLFVFFWFLFATFIHYGSLTFSTTPPCTPSDLPCDFYPPMCDFIGSDFGPHAGWALYIGASALSIVVMIISFVYKPKESQGYSQIYMEY